MKERRVTKIVLIMLALVCVFAIVACTGNVNPGGDACKHIYTEKAEATYLKSAATCTEKAVYYKSCSLCGEKDTATFEYGEPLGHAYGDWVSNGDGTHTQTCTNDATHKVTENCSGGTATCAEKATCEICNAKYGAQTYVEHTLNDDGECTICKQQIVGTEGVVYESFDTYAVVTGYTGTESKVRIASFYKNLPVISIENSAFMYCTSLASITIPDKVKSIGSSAFYNCTSLTDITIPDSVTSIGKLAFDGCTSLRYNEYDNAYYLGSKDDKYLYLIRAKSDSITSCTINNSCKLIFDSAFNGCESLKSITIPDRVTSIGEFTFDGCTSLTSVYIKDMAAWCKISFGNDSANPLYYAKKLYLNNKLVTALTIPDSVTSIGENAFYNCTSLTSITIGNNVTSIGSGAFYNCTSLTSVYIKDIAAWCKISFSHRGNPLHYAKKLYLNNKLVTTLTIPDSVTSVGNYAFEFCTSLASVTIPDSVTSIGRSAFSGCTSLTSVTIPDSVTSIGIDAFYNCASLQYIEYDNAYYLGSKDNKSLYLIRAKSTGITSCTILNNCKVIAGSAFNGCTSLTSVTIGNNVTSIGGLAFYGCTSLKNITIPDSVTSIGKQAFDGCMALESITIGNNVTGIGDWAFRGCTALTSVTIPDKVKRIGKYAFEDCESLTSVTMGNGVTSIGDLAFDNCGALKIVYYKGTAADWGKISIGSYNSCLVNATRYYYSESKPTTSGNYWHYVDGKPTVWASDGEN